VFESDFALPGLAAASSAGAGPRISIRMATPEQLRESWSGACGPPDWKAVLANGIVIQHELGLAHDQRFVYGSDTFLITPDARTVLCSVERPHDERWQRQLLDTILFSVSFTHGFELLHASAVEVDEGVVAFVAPTGGGKSSVATEFGRRGYRIVCDDVLAIGRRGDELFCHPGPAVMNIPTSASLPPSLGASLITTFADEDELWVALEHAATSPRTLRSVYLLDRSAGRRSVSKVTGATVLDLLPNSISLPHSAARARSRFELFSELAEQVPVFSLAAEPTASPGTLVDMAQASLEGAGIRLGVR
jgi:hypothetical protein